MVVEKHTQASLQNTLASISEFKGLQLEDGIAKYIGARLNRMEELEGKINEILMHHKVIDAPVRIRIGPELEFYNIAGEKSFSKRLGQLARANNADDPGEIFEERLAKDDSFMPKNAQQPSLNAAFKTKLEHARHVEVHKEPAYNTQIATERVFSNNGTDQRINRIALFQHEIVSPPRSPQGLGFWLGAIAQRIINKAPEYGLARSEIVTTLHDMSSSSLHFHISMMGEKDGASFNLMERDSYPEEKGSRKKSPKEISQLGLHIGQAMNEFLKDYIYIFAPTNDAYERFSDRHFVGTSFIGFSPRKERFNMGSAIFRGEGRETFRPEDKTGEPDKGPLRIELRVPDVSCIGHPNKQAYTDQMMAPFDVAEAMMYMLYKGVESWGKERDAMAQGKPTVPKTQQALYEQRYSLPSMGGEAATRMKNAQKRGDGFLTAARVQVITQRGLKHQHINDLDRKPNLPRGQTHDRSDLLPR